MSISFIQIVLILFLLFALSRVYLRFKGGGVRKIGFIFWSGLFTFAIVIVLFPDISSRIARAIGISRGVDTVVYTSIALIFYLIFRLHVFLEDIRNDITKIVSEIALKEEKKKNDKKLPQN